MKTTIQAEDWPEPIAASADVIRAVLFSGSCADFFRFKMARSDGWELWGIRGKKGWNIRTGTVQPLRELIAVSIGSKYVRKRLRASLLGRLFNQFEYFDIAATERVAAEFFEGASPPTLVSWVEICRD